MEKWQLNLLTLIVSMQTCFGIFAHYQLPKRLFDGSLRCLPHHVCNHRIYSLSACLLVYLLLFFCHMAELGLKMANLGPIMANFEPKYELFGSKSGQFRAQKRPIPGKKWSNWSQIWPIWGLKWPSWSPKIRFGAKDGHSGAKNRIWGWKWPFCSQNWSICGLYPTWLMVWRLIS